MSQRKLFFKNTFYNVFFLVITQLLNLFILPLFINNIGAELYGIWILSNIIIGYMGVLDFGFGIGVQKYLSKAYIGNQKLYFNQVFSTGIALHLFIGILIAILVVYFNHNIVSFFNIEATLLVQAQQVLLIAGIFSVLIWPMKMVSSVFPAILDYKLDSKLKAYVSFTKTLVLLLSVYISLDIVTIALIYNMVGVLMWLPTIFSVRKSVNYIQCKFSFVRKSVFKEIFSFSMGMFFLQLMRMLSVQLDNLIIGRLLSVREVSHYKITSTPFIMSESFLGMISGVIMPTIFAADANNNRALINRMAIIGVKYFAICSVPMALAGIVLTKPFFLLWVGSEYTNLVVWAQIYMLIYIIAPGFGVISNIVFALGHTKKVNSYFMLSVIINVTLSILLIPKYGIGGPILGTLISSITVTIPSFFHYCKILNLHWRDMFFTSYKIVLASTPLFLLLYTVSNFYLDFNNWMSFILFAALSLTCLLLPMFFFLEIEEKKKIKLLLGSLKLNRN
ncbi:hypothetical protein BZG01_03285 [Labilibaculum manganireducens]|uniref:Uncharacterized protein n=1 Tax=Labilibaculum manganireducens TaxID=1940525 RepID=A0A2N3IEI8_9BACT|nr:polysaccharide biosynthesis C-terminal domain-containing protein [Labilibaculum manganireducens]PKQ68754.1 hypothetical protein BZG01_03285 [Labilibaculum manganireducens]